MLLNRVFGVQDNPLFQLHMRRVRWWQGVQSLRPYTLRVMAWVVLALLTLWVGFIAYNYFTLATSRLFASYVSIIEGSFVVLLWGGAFAISLSFLLDFVVFAVAVNGIHGERTAGRWDLLRLTTLPMTALVESKHAVTQMRCWRATFVVVGVRLAIVLALLLQLFVLYPALEEAYFFRDFWDGFFREPYLFTVIGLALIVTGLTYIIEPFWRMRAVTALTLGLSAQVGRLSTAVALGFPLLLATWISQAAIVFGVGWLMIYFGQNVYDEYAVITLIFIWCVAVVGIIYGYYRLMAHWSLGWARRRAAKAD